MGRHTLRAVVERTLLIYVEDNSANFALAKRVLESTGHYDVVQAEDGATGRALVEERVAARRELTALDSGRP